MQKAIERINDKSKTFDTLRFNRMDVKEIVLSALEYVRHFIVKKNLILVGGMAIDYNLRLRNSKLYDDDVIPDYDFFSSDNAADAYQLASELCAKGFPEVDVITAIHTTTMKVRVSGHVVADITYVPKPLFDKLETLLYKNIRVIHPYHTVMDQTNSLSNPYENPPNEVITARWKKDITRCNMLLEAYPFKKHAKCPDSKNVELHELKLPAIGLQPGKKVRSGIFNGWIAIAYYQNLYKIKNPPLKTEWHGFNATAKIPVKYVTIMSTDWEAWTSPVTEYYNPLFSYFRCLRDSKQHVEVYDTWGARITITDIKEPVASVMAVFCYFLYRYIFAVSEESKKLATLGLHCVLDILEYADCVDVTPYGDAAWNVSTTYNVLNLIDPVKTKTWKPPTQQFTTPCTIERQFDPSQSPLFDIDGLPCKPWNNENRAEQVLLP